MSSAPGATLEKLAGGFEFTEGPASDAEGNVFFTDQPNDRILKWSVDGKLSTFLQPCGRDRTACASTPARQSWACADEKNELWCIDPDGKVTVVVKDYEGKLLNGPNDVWIRPDGGALLHRPVLQAAVLEDAAAMPAGPGSTSTYLSPDRKRLDPRDRRPEASPTASSARPTARRSTWPTSARARRTRYDIQARRHAGQQDAVLRAGLGRHDHRRRGQRLSDRQGRDGLRQDRQADRTHRRPTSRWTANVCFGGKDSRRCSSPPARVSTRSGCG